MTFSGKQFLTLQFSACFGAAMIFVGHLVDSIIVGRSLGVNALASLNLVQPFIYLLDLLVVVIFSGSSVLYNNAVGRFNREEANRVFSVVISTCGVIGFIIATLILLFYPHYLDFMGVTGVIRDNAEALIVWFAPNFVVGLIVLTIMFYIQADGGIRRYYSMAITLFIMRVIIELSLIRVMEVKVVTFSTWSAFIFVALIGLTHFRSSRNTLAFRPLFDWKLFAQTISLGIGSAGSSVARLFGAAVLTKFAAAYFGAEGLAVLAVVSSVNSLSEFFDGISEGVRPLVGVYHGEENAQGEVLMMKRAFLFSFAVGIAIGVVLFLWPNLVILLLGVDDSRIVEVSLRAIRLMALGMCFIPVGDVWNDYFQMSGHEVFAALMAIVRTVLVPLTFVLIIAYAFGPSGLGAQSLGLGAGLLVLAIVVFLIGGRKCFPYLISKERLRGVYNIAFSTNKSIAKSMERVHKIVAKEFPATDRCRVRIPLVVEEMVGAIKTLSKGKRVLIEVTIDCISRRIIVRDDGDICDLTNPDNAISSLGGYVLARIVSEAPQRVNLVTGGFNRNVIRFDAEV